MNDADDSLARELRSFRPVEPSAGFGERIAAELARPGRSPRSGRPGLLMGAGLVAASLALMACLERMGKAPPESTAATEAASVASVRTPTVLAYRQAWARSPDALDELLDQQSLRSSRIDAQDQPRSTLAALRTELLNLQGDRQ